VALLQRRAIVPGVRPVFGKLASVGLSVLAGSLLFVALPSSEAVGAKPESNAHAREGACVRQRPQSFLIRTNQLAKSDLPPAVSRTRASNHVRAVKYRLDEYGSIPGIGTSSSNPHSVSDQVERAQFMGHSLQVHKRIIAPLHCVEREIQHACRRAPYQPKAVGGYRDHNTYRGGEVSNHLFGIAVDIDPELNPCCGCVDPWPDNPRCRAQVRSVYERMAMPQCWVQSFEKYGFYWLGHDEMQDTMHFEFLGNPDRYDSPRRH
jgi:hypothetical protein